MLMPMLLLAMTAAPAGFEFRMQEIDTGLRIGYVILPADINGDQKPDLLVVDQHAVVWYENPTWKKRTILAGETVADNVCAAVTDVDGDGQLDVILGAAWKPFDTAKPGTLQWLRRGATLDAPWTLLPIPCEEPTVHRIQVTMIGESPTLIVAPLMGRGATAAGKWIDGRPVRILAYRIPKSNVADPRSWHAETIATEVHVVHNFTIDAKAAVLTTASFDGLTEFRLGGAESIPKRLHVANQINPKGNRGASEIARSPHGIATIEPWHGNQVVVYDATSQNRQVIDDHLRWGHAIKWMGGHIVAGVRDDPNPKLGETFTERRGVRLYARSATGWNRQIIDDGGMATEDLCVADFDGDGQLDIAACGRATKNVRIYWQTRPK
ncbi:MAG: FG-GAP repeat domain-containing protein [Gemmataceae bacterium]